MPRPPVAFLVWGTVPERAGEIAAALGGESRCFYPRRLASPGRKPARYLLSALLTAGYLARRRPRSVIATNPPVFVGMLAWAYGSLTGVPVVLDSHPGGFGSMSDRFSARMQPLHRWLARRARAVLVTTCDWAAVVQGWGGRAVELHEAPTAWPAVPAALLAGRRPQVLFVSTFGRDEPCGLAPAVAALLPEADMLMTGDLARAPVELLAAAPPNLHLLGYLDAGAYRASVATADIVLVLTTEPTSVMRSAYEAVYAGRPLVVSDWPNLRAVFPYAVHVANDAPAVAAGLRHALARHDQLLAAAGPARALQTARWEVQLRTLRGLLVPAVAADNDRERGGGAAKPARAVPPAA